MTFDDEDRHASRGREPKRNVRSRQSVMPALGVGLGRTLMRLLAKSWRVITLPREARRGGSVPNGCPALALIVTIVREADDEDRDTSWRRDPSALGPGTWRMGERAETRAHEIAALREGVSLGLVLRTPMKRNGEG